jgi:hypothetical protein
MEYLVQFLTATLFYLAGAPPVRKPRPSPTLSGGRRAHVRKKKDRNTVADTHRHSAPGTMTRPSHPPPPPPHPPPTNLAYVQLLAAQAARATREYRASRFRTGTTLRSGTDDIRSYRVARKRCVSYSSRLASRFSGGACPRDG